MALEFKQDGDYGSTVRVNDSEDFSPGTGLFSVCFWFKTSFTLNLEKILWRNYGSATANLVQVTIWSDEKIRGFFRDGNNNSISSFTTNTVNNGVWRHIAWVRNPATRGTLFLDGAEDTHGDNVSINNINVSDGEMVVMGGRYEADYSIRGELTDIRVYKRALSAAEIKTIYNARGSDNIVNDLKARWLLDELPDGSTADYSANFVKDVSGNGHHGQIVKQAGCSDLVYRAAPIKLVKPKIVL